ncbi:MAG: substrate-binding domain-containing protein [Lachnospiraceae bacterium]
MATKHEELEEYYRNQMRLGQVSAGQQLPAETEIAEQFCVSRHTVRQALATLEQEGYIRKVRGKGSFFSGILPQKKQKNIAVLTTYISDYIFPSIICGIEQELRERGYNLLLFNSNNQLSVEQECLKRIAENPMIQGVIVEPCQSAGNRLEKSFLDMFSSGVKQCLTIHTKYRNYDSACVSVDDEEGGYQQTKYLLDLGHTEIAAVFKVDDMQGIHRRAGYLRAMREYGVAVREEFLGEYVSDNQGVYLSDYRKRIVTAQNRPTALVCYNDKVALRMIDEMRNDGIACPQELSIVGFDDSGLAVSSDVKLTTIRHPKQELGIRAAKCMIDMIEGRIERPEYQYRAELIVRESAMRI